MFHLREGNEVDGVKDVEDDQVEVHDFASLQSFFFVLIIIQFCRRMRAGFSDALAKKISPRTFLCVRTLLFHSRLLSRVWKENFEVSLRVIFLDDIDNTIFSLQTSCTIEFAVKYYSRLHKINLTM